MSVWDDPIPPRHRAVWWEEALAGEAPCAALRGDVRCDVAIVGGGYLGLWTALRLKEQEPDCDVVLLEQDVCGGGASGRNGGQMVTWWTKVPALVEHWGVQTALELGRQSAAAVQDVADLCARYGVDAELDRDGWIWTATTPAHDDAWERTVEACERLGAGAWRRLSAEQVRARTGTAVHRGGAIDLDSACVHPAKLACGLRRVALQLGVRIFEGTHVTRLRTEGRPGLETAAGRVFADRVAIATNAWGAGLPGLRGRMVVVSSDIVATPPIPQRLDAIGWTDGVGIADSQKMVLYYRRTRDGRVIFGKGGWGIALGGRVPRSFDRDPARARVVAAEFRRVYPALADVPLTHDWSGPIDRTADNLPFFGRLRGNERVLYGVGFSGTGLAPTAIGGRILASLALGLQDQWSGHVLVDRATRRFPPEPFLYLGAHLVREAVVRKERAQVEGTTPHPLAVQLARLAP